MLEQRPQPQCEHQLSPGLHARPENANARAVRPRQEVQAQATGRARALRGNGISIENARWTAIGWIHEHDRCLMRLATPLAIGWPEAGCLETQQRMSGHVASLDAEHGAAGKLFPDKGEHPTCAPAMQDEGFPNC